MLVFLPILISFATGKEFWPFTSFPMYSKPYYQFWWPSVLVRPSKDSDWTPMYEEKCFGRLGYVRFHFSVFNFASEKREAALGDLTRALVTEIKRNCPDRSWRFLKISLINHEVRSTSPNAANMMRELTPEVPLDR